MAGLCQLFMLCSYGRSLPASKDLIIVLCQFPKLLRQLFASFPREPGRRRVLRPARQQLDPLGQTCRKQKKLSTLSTKLFLLYPPKNTLEKLFRNYPLFHPLSSPASRLARPEKNARYLRDIFPDKSAEVPIFHKVIHIIHISSPQICPLFTGGFSTILST